MFDFCLKFFDRFVSFFAATFVSLPCQQNISFYVYDN